MIESKMIDNDKYQLIIVNSTYEIASDELGKSNWKNKQFS